MTLLETVTHTTIAKTPGSSHNFVLVPVSRSSYKKHTFTTMVAFQTLKERTQALKTKVLERTQSLRWRRRTAFAKTRFQSDRQHVSDFAATSALIANTFSQETHSSHNTDLYRPSKKPTRVEHALPPSSIQNNNNNNNSNNNNQDTPVLPPYSISASMLCSNIDKGIIPPNSTESHMIFSPTRVTNSPRAGAPFRPLYYSTSTTHNDNQVPPAIGRTESKESTVSSVTMYSSYHNDPLVRASNNLYDILRKHNHQQQQRQQPHTDLYEA
jgi:hypothetical protein